MEQLKAKQYIVRYIAVDSQNHSHEKVIEVFSFFYNSEFALLSDFRRAIKQKHSKDKFVSYKIISYRRKFDFNF